MEIFIEEYSLLIPTFLNIFALSLLYISPILNLLHKKRKRFSVAFTGFIAIVSTCLLLPSILLKLQYLSEPKNLYRFARVNIYIRGSPNEYQIAEIKTAFRDMNDLVSQSIKIISFREPGHFNNVDHEAGHVGCGKGVICFPAKTFTDRYAIEHEAAHLYTFVLGTNFVKEWSWIAGSIYDKYIKKDRHRFIVWSEGNEEGLRYGCVGAYGAKTVYEDIATFYEYICNLLVSPDMRDFLQLQSAHLKDRRYERKINLLYKYKFINKEQHKLIKKMLD